MSTPVFSVTCDTKSSVCMDARNLSCCWAGTRLSICYSWRLELQDLKTIKETIGGEAGIVREAIDRES